MTITRGEAVRFAASGCDGTVSRSIRAFSLATDSRGAVAYPGILFGKAPPLPGPFPRRKLSILTRSQISSAHKLYGPYRISILLYLACVLSSYDEWIFHAMVAGRQVGWTRNRNFHRNIWEAFLLFRKKRVQISTDFESGPATGLNVLLLIDAPLNF